MRHHRLLLICLLISPSALAQIRSLARHSEASRTVVSTYCRMDYEGGRLAENSWERMKRLTDWKDNPDWLGFTVVSQYEVLSSDDKFRSASVQVQYVVLGRFERGMGYAAEPGHESVSFSLRDVDSQWKIDAIDPPINPHVSKTRAVAWLKASLATAKDAAGKLMLERALKDLGASP